jgi:hypothetical protein
VPLRQPFRHFVDVDADAIDLIDSVAYAMYKQRKLQFLQTFEDANGRPASSQEIQNFILAAALPASVEAFRTAATEALREFSEEVLTVAETEVEERYKAELIAKLSAARPFWTTLGENILANLGALAAIALVLVVIYGARLDAATLIGGKRAVIPS